MDRCQRGRMEFLGKESNAVMRSGSSNLPRSTQLLKELFIENPKCQDCKWAEYRSFVYSSLKYECRRNPPTAIRDHDTHELDRRWPPVAADDYCGKFELSE